MAIGSLRLTIAALAVSLAFSTGFVSAARAQAGAGVLEQLESSLVDLISRCERSVVSISRSETSPDQFASDANDRAALAQQRRLQLQQQALPGALFGVPQIASPTPNASGAGVVIDSSGLVLTEFNVVRLGETHIVTDVEGRRYLATIRAADSRSGLAVLAVTKPLDAGDSGAAGRFDLPALPIGQAERLRKGRFVVAIGNPFAIESDGQPTASWGTVTNTAAKAPQGEPLGVETPSDGQYRTTLHHFGSLIQTDAKLGWNASGGAIVTLDGVLVGVTTTAAAIAGHEQPAGYAIPLNDSMRRAVDTMKQGLEPEYGLLGVGFNRIMTRSPTTGRLGIAVDNAYRGGPAHMAGLRPGDLLTTVAGKSITSAEALQLTVGNLPPGEPIQVGFERNGEPEETTVTLGKAYVEEGQIVTRRRPSWRGLRIDYATAVPPAVLNEKSREGHLDESGCVVVSEVEEGSVSWRSGVRPYSYISHVGGERVTSPEEFYAAVRDAEDNVKLKFTKPLPPVPGAAGGAAIN